VLVVDANRATAMPAACSPRESEDHVIDNTNDSSTDQTMTSSDAGNATASSGPSQTRARRGFAVMDLERVRAIARLGGKAAHTAGTAHEFTPDEARSAGRKGGLAPHRPRRTKRMMAAAKVEPSQG
jgi:uncharacterized protein